MQTTTRRAEYIWSIKQDRYIPVRRLSSVIWTKCALCKGASAQQNNLENQQAGFYQTLQNDYSQQFANQNSILSTLTNSLNPIIAAGPNQFGFNNAEVNNLNSQAIQGTGQQYANASKALKSQQAALGGGNTLLPSGVSSQEQAGLASASANQASQELLGVQQAGYQQGYNTYESAIGQLGGVASQYNPTGYANASQNSQTAAGNEANTIQQANAAASPWNFIAPILGGVAQAGLGLATGGLSTIAQGASDLATVNGMQSDGNAVV